LALTGWQNASPHKAHKVEAAAPRRAHGHGKSGPGGGGKGGCDDK
jgi:hypothetical protein